MHCLEFPVVDYPSFGNIRLGLCGFGRARRRQAREQSGARAEHKEGLSSDDEETSADTTSFNLERGNGLNLLCESGCFLLIRMIWIRFTIFLCDLKKTHQLTLLQLGKV